jgi:predicted RNA-binding protein with PIN domain
MSEHPAASAFDGVEQLYVDAMNVIGSRPDGWWRDRDGAVRRLAARLQAFAAPRDTEVVLVVDGRPISGLPEGRNGAVLVRYARRAGRDAADDRLVELLEAADPGGGHAPDVRVGATVVVTADRELRARVSVLGAEVVGPHRLLTALDDPSAPVD